MKKTKGQSGITLIALVVTIVVLLILAGITITYVLSDGGIFSTAKRASKENEAGVIRDYVTNAQGSLMAQTYTPGTTTVDAADIMTKNFPTSGYTLTTTSLTAADGKFGGSFTATKGDVTYTITFDTNGVATVTYPGQTTDEP